MQLLVCAVVLTFGSASCKAGLLTNGSLETGNFTGWNRQGDTGFTGVRLGGFSGQSPTEGNYQAFSGPVFTFGGINQAVATTAGQSYALSYDLASLSGTPSSYRVSINGNVVDSGANFAFAYTHRRFDFTATSSSTIIQFDFYHDSFFLLDNVQVVPEPGSMALMGMGAIALICGSMLRRRVKKLAA